VAEELDRARVENVVRVGDVTLEPQQIARRALGHRQVLAESGQRRGVGAGEHAGCPRDEPGDDGGIPVAGRVLAERREHRVVAGPPRAGAPRLFLFLELVQPDAPGSIKLPVDRLDLKSREEALQEGCPPGVEVPGGLLLFFRHQFSSICVEYGLCSPTAWWRRVPKLRCAESAKPARLRRVPPMNRRSAVSPLPGPAY